MAIFPPSKVAIFRLTDTDESKINPGALARISRNSLNRTVDYVKRLSVKSRSNAGSFSRSGSNLISEATARRTSSFVSQTLNRTSFGVTNPISLDFCNDLKIEYLQVKADFYKKENYIVQIDQYLIDDFEQDPVYHRNIHLLSSSTDGMQSLIPIAEELERHYKFDMPECCVTFHAEFMGRESRRFENTFAKISNFLVYFDGYENESFNNLRITSRYRSRLLQVSPCLRLDGLSRGWEVPCNTTHVKDDHSYVLDLGRHVYCYQRVLRPKILMYTKLLANVLGLLRDTMLPEKIVDDDFWKILESGDKSENSGGEMVIRKNIHPEKKSLWYVKNYENPTLINVAEDKIKEIMMTFDGSGSDFFIVDVAGTELFVSVEAPIPFSCIYQILVNLYFKYHGNTSASIISRQSNQVDSTFDDVFDN